MRKEQQLGRQSQQQQAKRRKYDTINLEKRVELIERVVQQRERITKVAQDLGIKTNTAKCIVRKYKQEGTILIRKQEIQRFERENPSLFEEEQEESASRGPQEEIGNPYSSINLYNAGAVYYSQFPIIVLLGFLFMFK